MAIDSLARVLPQWHATGQTLRRLNPQLSYKLPDRNPAFIGIISQRYRPRSGKPAEAFRSWIDAIVERVQDLLVPELSKIGMTISAEAFQRVLPNASPFELAQIADFNSLIAHSQDNATPVFALKDIQLESAGVVLEQKQESRNRFRETFTSLAASVHALTKFKA